MNEGKIFLKRLELLIHQKLRKEEKKTVFIVNVVRASLINELLLKELNKRAENPLKIIEYLIPLGLLGFFEPMPNFPTSKNRAYNITVRDSDFIKKLESRSSVENIPDQIK